MSRGLRTGFPALFTRRNVRAPRPGEDQVRTPRETLCRPHYSKTGPVVTVGICPGYEMLKCMTLTMLWRDEADLTIAGSEEGTLRRGVVRVQIDP